MSTKEQDFEATIEADLIMSGGCLEGDPENFDPVRGVVQSEVLGL